jgi:hypothetical protein
LSKEVCVTSVRPIRCLRNSCTTQQGQGYRTNKSGQSQFLCRTPHGPVACQAPTPTCQ